MADSRQSEAHHGQNCSLSRLKITRRQKCRRKVPLNHCPCELDTLHTLRAQKQHWCTSYLTPPVEHIMAISLTYHSWPPMKPRLHSRAESCHLPVSDVDTSKGQHSKWPAPPNPQCPTWADELQSDHGMIRWDPIKSFL